MKKVLCVILTVFISISMAACGNKTQGTEKKGKTSGEKGKTGETGVSINYQVGDFVTFGRYDVDGKEQNGTESIEWLILDEKDGSFLIISKDIIFTERFISSQQYNRNEWAKWDNSNIRKKMNVDFYDEAFNEDEKNMISVTNVLPGNNPYYGKDPGISTEDKVFLLSVDEVNKYFPNEKDRVCSIADSLDTDTFSSDWCTRTPGQSDATVVAVSSKDGSIVYDGYYTLNYFGVRPAMWVNSDLLKKYEPNDIKHGDKGGEQQPAEEITVCEVGDYITLGKYEQDNNTNNGEEEIKWFVLDIQDQKALVVSIYALDCQQYNTENTDVTWETCTLRKWLNNDFYNNAFSEAEKAIICNSTIPIYDNQNGIENSTEDKVFLLSLDECEKYSEFGDGRCEPTKFAKAQGDIVIEDNIASWWYRSSGDEQNEAFRFWCKKRITSDFKSYDVDSYGGVLPAMWIKINT